MKASELLREVEAEAKLKRFGWTKCTCPACKGDTGYDYVTEENGKDVARWIGCLRCNQSGYVWENKDESKIIPFTT